MQIGIPDETLASTAERYERDRVDREKRLRRLKKDGVLGAEEPERIARRLARLGADPTVTDAVSKGDTDVARVVRRAAKRPGDDPNALERVLGLNDLIGVGFLRAGARAARCVGRVVVRTAAGGLSHYGTGFLVSPSLLMTNNHVLEEPAGAARAHVEFDYELGPDGFPLPATSFALAPGAFFITDEKLDFSLVGVERTGSGGAELAGFGWNPLVAALGKAVVGESLNVIQHPNGEPKQIALRENKLVGVLDDFLHYETDTAPGSSGSPVLNDQWEVVALHHSGVPARDADGNIVAIDGAIWNPAMGEHRVKWAANEGARVSRLVERIEGAALSGAQAALRAELLSELESAPVTHAPPGGVPMVAANGQPGATLTVGSDATLTIPLQITLSLPAVAAAGQAVDAVALAAGATTQAASGELREALDELAAAKDRPYYDAKSDEADRDPYYESIDPKADGQELFTALSELLESTHAVRPAYKPFKHVYPWVDLRPELNLRSIYSDKPFDPQDVIEEDFRAMETRAVRLKELSLGDGGVLPDQRGVEFDMLEALAPFNCEHVVPQSWFLKAEPMKGDLHHLFTCESRCNSFRNNTPYWEFADFEETVRGDCGKSEGERFEPNAGKGTVARAVLYFLLRYPGQIDDEEVELEAERIDILLGWHKAEPPGEYDQHRNAAIFAVQGNRNPVIDFPEWATRIDFTRGLAGQRRFKPRKRATPRRRAAPRRGT